MAQQLIILHHFLVIPVADEEVMDAALVEFINDTVQEVYKKTEGSARIDDIDVKPLTVQRQVICLIKLVFTEQVDPVDVDFDSLVRFEHNNLYIAMGEGIIQDFDVEWLQGRMRAYVLTDNGQELELIGDREGNWYIYEEAQDE